MGTDESPLRTEPHLRVEDCAQPKEPARSEALIITVPDAACSL